MKSFVFLIFVAVCQASNVALNTGYKIPLIGRKLCLNFPKPKVLIIAYFSVGTYGFDFSKILSIVDEALGAGYRLFDSAHLYRNEKELGAAFAEHLPRHNLARSDIFITTKIREFEATPKPVCFFLMI